MIKIRRGMDLPISGAPDLSVTETLTSRSVAVLGDDFVGMKPTMAVDVGDKVKLGQELFEDKKNPGVKYTAPASGTVSAINRGDRRVLQSVVIDVDGDDAIDFGAADIASLERQAIVDKLVASGEWVALRTRPYGKVPAINSTPAAIFVNAMDTNPLAASPELAIAESAELFEKGLQAIAKLSDKTYLTVAGDSSLSTSVAGVEVAKFDGVHPAGLPGTHIHFLHPVNESTTVWTINAQDVIAFGGLFASGKVHTDRLVSLAGPQVETPRLVKVNRGADLVALAAGNLKDGETRVISGSVLNGRIASGAEGYLGRYDVQVSALKEGHERPMLHFFNPGANRHSELNIYLSKFNKSKKFDFTTNTNGGERGMVPSGSYERVMPQDYLPTQLLRAILVGDTDMAQKLGALELVEEDLALCTYVCPAKYEYGSILRDNLTRIEIEG